MAIALDEMEFVETETSKQKVISINPDELTIKYLAKAVLSSSDEKLTKQLIETILHLWSDNRAREDFREYRYTVKSTEDLKKLIREVEKVDLKADLNWIDVSALTDLSYLFFYKPFNGDISRWDVSNVRNMSSMFDHSKFNGDLSDWDVFNVTDMRFMFHKSDFNKDISTWQINPQARTEYMFLDCAIDNSNKP